ncbi:hypothetical protein PG989_006609 [Apiospora arundinis]
MYMSIQPFSSLTLLLVALRPTDAIHANSVETTDSWSCDASRGIDVNFTPAPEHHQLLVRFPTIALTVMPPAHGNPGGYSDVGCSATVGFLDFSSQRRFAIANVTWRADNGIGLAKGQELYRLDAKVEYRIERFTGTYPIKYPIVKDLSTATMLDMDNIDPKLGAEGYQGVFEYTAQNPDRVCLYSGLTARMDTREMSQRCILRWGGHTRGGGTSLPGWSMDLGLVWEDCHPTEEHGWGQTIINGWESCTYRTTNQTSNNLLPDVFRKSKKS